MFDTAKSHWVTTWGMSRTSFFVKNDHERQKISVLQILFFQSDEGILQSFVCSKFLAVYKIRFTYGEVEDRTYLWCLTSPQLFLMAFFPSLLSFNVTFSWCVVLKKINHLLFLFSYVQNLLSVFCFKRLFLLKGTYWINEVLLYSWTQ